MRVRFALVLLAFILGLSGCGPAAAPQSPVPQSPALASAPSAGAGATAPTAPAQPAGEAELQVMALFRNGEVTADEDVRQIIALLPSCDWGYYARANGERLMAFLAWLDNRPISDVADIANVLQGGRGLDGAYSEKYSAVVGTLFTADPAKFVKALGLVAPDQADQAVSLVGYYAAYQQPDVPPARQQLEILVTSSTLTGQEAERAGKLLKVLDLRP